MTPLHITILDDEENYIRQLAQELQHWGREHNTAVSIRSFSCGEDFLKEEFDDTELLFLDIDLQAEHLNGLDIAKKLRKDGFRGNIIFLTAFSEYVFEGYNVRAHDFLIKPIDAERLAKCLKPIVKSLDGSFHVFQFREETFKIPYNKILAFSSYKHYVDIATLIPAPAQEKNAFKTFQQRISIRDLEPKLPEEFVRCHRSVIINASKMISMTKMEAVLINDTVYPVSKSYLEEVREAFMKVLGC